MRTDARGHGRTSRTRPRAAVLAAGLLAAGLAATVAATLATGGPASWLNAAPPTSSPESTGTGGDTGPGNAENTHDNAARKSATKTPEPLPPVSPVPLSVPAPTPSPLTDEVHSIRAADTAIDSLVAANNEILQRADGGTQGLQNIAAGFVWGELQALATERAQLGYRQVGEATIRSVTARAVDLEASPPTVVLDVCVDATGVDIVDANGQSLRGLLYDPGSPTLNVYGAQYLDGLWKIATHEIPDSAPCA